MSRMSTTSPAPDVADPAALPDLSSNYPLPPERVDSFRRDGHVVLRGVASGAEAAAYAPVIERAVRAHAPQLKKLQDRDTYGKAFIQIGNLWEKDAACKRFSFSR